MYVTLPWPDLGGLQYLKADLEVEYFGDRLNLNIITGTHYLDTIKNKIMTTLENDIVSLDLYQLDWYFHLHRIYWR